MISFIGKLHLGNTSRYKNYVHLVFHFVMLSYIHIETDYKSVASTVKVGHFEWLTKYTGVTGQIVPSLFH